MPVHEKFKELSSSGLLTANPTWQCLKPALGFSTLPRAIPLQHFPRLARTSWGQSRALAGTSWGHSPCAGRDIPGTVPFPPAKSGFAPSLTQPHMQRADRWTLTLQTSMGSGGHPGNSRATIGVRLRSSTSPARGPQAGRGVSSRSQGCRNLGPGGAGHAPRDRFLQLGGDGRWQQGLPKPLGARFGGRAQRVSGCCGRSGPGWPPQLARRDCQRQRHPPVTAPRARWDSDATKVLPRCQWSKAPSVLGQHLHLPPRRVPAGVPQGCTPPTPPQNVPGSKVLPCPVHPALPRWRKLSIISLAHQRQLLVGAPCVHRCKRYAPEIPGFYI